MRTVTVATETDFIARLADAWDGRGRSALSAPRDHQALLRLASLSESLWNIKWLDLDGPTRERLVFAARTGVDLGRTCAWVFGAAA